MGIAGVVAVGGGDVVVPAQPQEADGQAAQGRHDAGRVPGPDQGFVLLVGDASKTAKASAFLSSLRRGRSLIATRSLDDDRSNAKRPDPHDS